MKKSIIAFLFLLTLFTVKVDAAILWQENYDGMSTAWDCTNALTGGQMSWTVPATCLDLTVGGVFHHCGEITNRGLSGNGLTLWKNVTAQGVNVQYVGAESSGKLYYIAYATYHMYLLAGTYSTGTIVSFSDTTVTGSGTAWLANVVAGDFLKLNGSNIAYQVGSVQDDTHLTTTTSRTSGSGGYTIDKLRYDINLNSASYNTVQELVGYIDGLADWTASLGGDISGSRNSNNLVGKLITDCKTSSLWIPIQFYDGFCGYPGHDFTQSEFDEHHKELFFRWYWKYSADWDAYLYPADSHKLTRFLQGTSPTNSTSQFYFNIDGATFKTGQFAFYITKEGPVRYTSQTLTQLGVVDGQWHYYEIHFKMNSATGVSDGELHFYIDGNQKSIYIPFGDTYPTGLTNWNFGFAANEYISTLPPPALGNLSGGYYTFPDDAWYGWDFDYFAVGDSYIGAVSPSSGYTNYGITSGGSSFR